MTGDNKASKAVAAASAAKAGELMSDISQCRKDPILDKTYDIVLRVGAKEFYAHKCILACRSPYFQSLLLGDFAESSTNQEKRSEEGKQIVHIRTWDEDLSPERLEETFEAVVDFIYSDNIQIQAQDAKFFFDASRFFGLPTLQKECEEFYRQSIDSGGVCQILSFAEAHEASYLREKCILFILENFEDAAKSSSFLRLSVDLLREILVNDDLKVASESAVYDAVYKWAQATANESSEIPQTLALVADLVRWPLIPNEKLLDIQETSIAPTQLVTEAIRWRMAPARNKFSSDDKDLIRRKTPRTYHQKYPLTLGFLDSVRNNELPKGPGACILQVTRIDSPNPQNNWQHTQQAANETQAEANTQRDHSDAAATTTTATTAVAQPEGASRGTQAGVQATTTTNPATPTNATNTGNANNANSDNKVPVTDGLQMAPLPIANHPSLLDKKSLKDKSVIRLEYVIESDTNTNSAGQNEQARPRIRFERVEIIKSNFATDLRPYHRRMHPQQFGVQQGQPHPIQNYAANLRPRGAAQVQHQGQRNANIIHGRQFVTQAGIPNTNFQYHVQAFQAPNGAPNQAAAARTVQLPIRITHNNNADQPNPRNHQQQ